MLKKAIGKTQHLCLTLSLLIYTLLKFQSQSIQAALTKCHRLGNLERREIDFSIVLDVAKCKIMAPFDSVLGEDHFLDGALSLGPHMVAPRELCSFCPIKALISLMSALSLCCQPPPKPPLPNTVILALFQHMNLGRMQTFRSQQLLSNLNMDYLSKSKLISGKETQFHIKDRVLSFKKSCSTYKSALLEWLKHCSYLFSYQNSQQHFIRNIEENNCMSLGEGVPLLVSRSF